LGDKLAIARGKQRLEQRVGRFIEEHHLVSHHQRLVVAVSGGPDSVCLLHVLSRLQEEWGITLHVAHLNHQLRGAEADADAQYVADLARRLGIPATIDRRGVAAYQAQQRLSLEEAAREVRYTFLAEVAGSIGASRVAVGHTADDHIETLLMHLIRGTGTRGLRGLQPLTEWRSISRNITVIRPLLQVGREETTAYCAHHQLAPRIDTSNLSLSTLRNKIRHQLLPLLQGYNPQITETLLRTARLATDEVAFLDEEIARLWDSTAQRQENTIILDKEMFCQLPVALQRHLLRVAIEKLVGNVRDIETRHIDGIMAALGKPAGRSLNLPSGLIFSIDYNRFLIGQAPAALSPFPILDAELALNVPGETRLPGWWVRAAIISPHGMGHDASTYKARFFLKEGPEGAKHLQNLPLPLSFEGEGDKGGEVGKQCYKAYFDLDKAGNKLVVRRRQPGDRFQPLGMSQPKKLNEFMIDVKISRSWRQRIPLVCSSEHILWVVGWRIDDRVKVTQDTKQILRLEFKQC
jgi:tRNA(Ile)-lysidine synthase